ncbi:hypothetical protein CCAN12_640038 [Capnocytophaga canimorsus]|uniref:Uncharacterized protein n=1 Tax=Capnocytophaga canimorsus TaxID=28188 RepID=A0A0B7H8W6_9FLAO|nr:hypothetical protein CCAN12_640038 [Capnocytophaga canimorsus]
MLYYHLKMKASEFLKENGFSQDTIEKILQCGKVILLKKKANFSYVKTKLAII